MNDNDRTPIPGYCSWCGARVPDAEAVSVGYRVSPRCSVLSPVCDDCYTPEFKSYLEEKNSFWLSDEGRGIYARILRENPFPS